MQSNIAIIMLTATCAGPLAPVLAGPEPPMPSREVEHRLDSGPVTVLAGSHAGDGYGIAYQTVLSVPGATWLRINFERVELSGVIEEGTASYLRITSLADGGVQLLNSESLAQWAGRSAYMNGESVHLELLARPHPPNTSHSPTTGPNRIIIATLTAGVPEVFEPTDSICDGVDLRTLSNDPRAGRPLPTRCTAWLFGDTNRTFLAAGHCRMRPGDAVEFNVPLSGPTGTPMHAYPDDQYPVDVASIQEQSGSWSVGHDWAYFGCFPNSNTGLTPFQAQGDAYRLALEAPPVSGQMIVITGFGSVSAPVSPTWNRVQKTHAGPYVNVVGNTLSYRPDTTAGNSGSAVKDESTGLVIGIHTHGGCTSIGGANRGTNIAHPEIQSALADPQGVCRTGWADGLAPEPPLFAVGDLMNNFGTLSLTTGQFVAIAPAPPRMEGMAYSPRAGEFYTVSFDMFTGDRNLYSIDPESGEAVLIAPISGPAEPINGLGFDAVSGILYGIAQVSGQLYSIGTASGAASPIGSAEGGAVGALDWDPLSGLLYGIDDDGGASRLIVIDPSDGSRTVIGALGAGISDCNGLAITDAGDIYTIDAASGNVLQVDRQTGAATVLGPSHGLWNASYGLAAVIKGPEPCYANCDGSTTPPILTVDDFTCFINAFTEAQSLPYQQQIEHYANCDGSTGAPVLTVDDFTCFINAFAAGCP